MHTGTLSTSQTSVTQPTKHKLELHMFYQTYTARKPPSACTPVTPSPPAATQWFRLLLHLCCVRRTHYNALSMKITQQFSRFCPWWPWLWPLTLTFKLVRARDQTRLPCKFDANPFSGSRNIWVTNKQIKVIIALKTEPYLRAVKINMLLLRSIVMSRLCLSVCLFVRDNISGPGTTRAIFTNFLCMLAMSMARSSSDMLTIGRIAYRREGSDGHSAGEM